MPHRHNGLDRIPGVKSPGYRVSPGVVIVQCADCQPGPLALPQNYPKGNPSAMNPWQFSADQLGYVPESGSSSLFSSHQVETASPPSLCTWQLDAETIPTRPNLGEAHSSLGLLSAHLPK